jgi:hypothetical protein
VVPKHEELKESLASIFQALQAMRGFSNFAGAGRSVDRGLEQGHFRGLVGGRAGLPGEVGWVAKGAVIGRSAHRRCGGRDRICL